MIFTILVRKVGQFEICNRNYHKNKKNVPSEKVESTTNNILGNNINDKSLVVGTYFPTKYSKRYEGICCFFFHYEKYLPTRSPLYLYAGKASSIVGAKFSEHFHPFQWGNPRIDHLKLYGTSVCLSQPYGILICYQFRIFPVIPL